MCYDLYHSSLYYTYHLLYFIHHLLSHLYHPWYHQLYHLLYNIFHLLYHPYNLPCHLHHFPHHVYHPCTHLYHAFIIFIISVITLSSPFITFCHPLPILVTGLSPFYHVYYLRITSLYKSSKRRLFRVKANPKSYGRVAYEDCPQRNPCVPQVVHVFFLGGEPPGFF